MQVDLIIKNGKIVTPHGVYEGGVAIDAGRIVAIAKDSALPESHASIDAHGNMIIPGVVDAHVHMWDPGWQYREDWKSGTMSAAGGGTTTVVDHALSSKPPPITCELMRSKVKYAKERAVVDFALHSSGLKETISEIPKLIKEGVTGFKVFMAESVPEFAPLDDGTLYEIFHVIAENRSLALVHAENIGIINHLREKFKKERKNAPIYHPLSRPSIAEVEATSRAIILAKQWRCKLYVVHVSTPSAMEVIKQARKQGLQVYAETCPQYLLLDDSVYENGKLGPYACINPPLRSKAEVNEMWQYIQDGTIDVVASDHAPYARHEKEPGWENVWEIPSGAPGLETLVPLLINQVSKGHLTIERLVQLMCYNPARLLGLYPQKGAIQVGSDGDITIIDMKKTSRIEAEKLHFKHGYTPFEQWKIKGVPVMTIVRGEVVMENGYPGDIVGEPGYGDFVPSKHHDTK